MEYKNGKRQFKYMCKKDKERIFKSLSLNLTSKQIQEKHNITHKTLDKIIKERITSYDQRDRENIKLHR